MSIFNEKISIKTPASSNFDMSFTSRFSCKGGVLIPHYVQDVVPGDYFKISNALLARTMPLVAPMLTDFKISQHFFFVPKRLLWKNFERYITGGKDGTSEAKYVDGNIENSDLIFPYLNINGFYDGNYGTRKKLEDFVDPFDDEPDYNMAAAMNGSLSDFLGLPKSHYHIDSDGYPSFDNEALGSNQPIPLWRWDAYWLIVKQYYKDENLDYDNSDDDDTEFKDWLNDVNYNFGFHYENSGLQSYYTNDGYFSFWRRAWKKDYFTSALPWAQRGQEAVMPLITREDSHVEVDYNSSVRHDANVVPDGTPYTDAIVGTAPASFAYVMKSFVDDKLVLAYKKRDESASGGFITQYFNLDFNGTQEVDFNNLPLFSIRELRRTEAIQRLLEKLARGGSRFSEMLLSVFGVRPADARVQRPDFIGGTTQRLMVDEVQQNSQTTDDSALGTLAGRGISAANGYICDYNVTEHGIIMGILSIVPKASYQQGLDKNLTRGLVLPVPDDDDTIVLSDRYEEYWPDFAKIGEQAIYNKELYVNTNEGTSVDANDGIFGYQMRYSEMKCRNDEVHGMLAQELDYWHAGRIFENRPHLNQDFVMCKPTNRIFAITDDGAENFVIDVQHDVKMSRPMPYFGEPSLIG